MIGFCEVIWFAAFLVKLESGDFVWSNYISMDIESDSLERSLW